MQARALFHTRIVAAVFAAAIGLASTPAVAAPGDVLFRDRFNGNLNAWTVASAGGDASIGNETSKQGRSLRLRWGPVSVTSASPIAAAVPGAELAVWVRRGHDDFSEDPDAGEDLRLEYFSAGGTWEVLDVFPGDGPDGQIFDNLYTLPADALHANLRLRFVLTAGSGGPPANAGLGWDYWHVDELVVTEITGTPALVFGSCDDFETGLGNWTIERAGGDAGVGTQAANSGTRSLFTRWGPVTVTSVAVDASAAAAAVVEAWIRRGADAFSEDPDGGEDLVVEFLDVGGNWVALETFPGGGPDGEVLTPAYVLPAAALHAGLRVRFRQTGGSGPDFDYWHIDDVCVRAPAAPAPVAEWRFDESAWNAPGDVADASGNGHDGTAFNTTPVPGLLCNAADFRADATSDYITAPGAALDGLGDFTLMFWGLGTRNRTMTSVSAANAGQANEALAFFPSYSRFQPHLKGVSIGNIGTGGLAGDWHHFAWTRTGNTHCLFLDGVLAGCRSSGSSAPLSVAGNGVVFGQEQDCLGGCFNRSQDWEGLIDELLVFDRVLADTEIRAIRDNHLAGRGWDGSPRVCPNRIDRFTVDVGGGGASTCRAAPVVITARDLAGNVLTDYDGTIVISTSSGHGDWAAVDESGQPGPDPGQGALTPGAPDSGGALYTFVPGTGAGEDAGSVTLFLHNQHAETLTVSVVDATVPASLSVSAALAFADNAFDVVVTDPLGDVAVAGRAHALRLEMVRRDPVTGDCGVATGYDVGDVKAWYVPALEHPPGAAAPALATASETETLPPAEPGAVNLTLPFSAGTADVALATTDVGKYTLHVKDDSGTFADGAIAGSSVTFTVRPFALAFTGIAAGGTPNPGTEVPGGARFAAAGEPFEATLAAYQWSAGDDADDDGVPDAGADVTDNGLTPSFAWPVTVSAVPHAPDAAQIAAEGGEVGALAGGNVAAGDFAAGAATLGALAYPEVGAIRLEATASAYLGTAGADVSGSSALDGGTGAVGRFGAHHFDISVDVSPQLVAACSGFTYIDQPFDFDPTPGAAPRLTVRARAADGELLDNYHDFTASGGADWWLLDLATGVDDAYTDAAAPAAVALTHTGGYTPASGSGTNGEVQLTLFGPFTYANRGGPSAGPLAPFAAAVRLDLTVTDTDGATGTHTIDPIAFTDPGQRWGRLVADSALGSELLDLSLPLRAEYFDGGAFVDNGDDDCTALTLADDVELANPETAGGAAQPGDATMTVAAGGTAVTSGDPALAGGRDALVFSAPGAGNTGFVDVRIDLSASDWLRFDWDGDGDHDDDPQARASFGLFGGTRELIYIREPWN